MRWIFGILAAIAAWAARNFLFGRTEERLTKERDAARVEAEEAKIQAEGKTHEAAVLKNLQKKKAALDGLDGDALLDELNARNR